MVLNVTPQTCKYAKTFDWMLLNRIKIGYKIQIIYVFTKEFHTHVQNQNLSQIRIIV